MSASAAEGSEFHLPETLSWAELQQLPDGIAEEIELWQGRVVWNRSGPLEHQRFAVRMRNALEGAARRAMEEESGGSEQRCWQVGVETNVFFTPDKSSFLTPDFLVRRCLPRGADTSATGTVLVGEVLSGSDALRRREWKMARYAEAAIPWYWEIELDSGGTWDVASVRAYELVTIDRSGLAVEPLRPSAYVAVGQWEPEGLGIEFPEPFALSVSWEDLAF
ncbi:Uma2 family endonuclease [Streptomyces sp. NPDC047123]|uniref:Uma2 family endonuclease n=1 Tax=Streptomyces sp. NPDC047123 TaxID=3155622 RepID=UPI00340CEFD5